MAYDFTTNRRVEFSDTDMAGIMHFARFFVFMETAEHQFLNSLGTSVHAVRDGRTLGWPRLAASCEFFRPVCFEDELDMPAFLRKRARAEEEEDEDAFEDPAFLRRSAD